MILRSFFLLSILAYPFFSQTTCQTALPFCSGGVSGVTFPASTNAGNAQPGPNYGCLLTTPNPAWYYLQISQAGNLDILIQGTAFQDVDFICWGPFTSLAGVCNSLTAANTVDCSYSSSFTETLNIVNAQVGQYYMVLITNFSNATQNIIFTQIAGTGSTNCSIVSSNTVICYGQSATLTINNNSNLSNPSYSIQPGGQTSSTNSFVVSPSVTTTYSLYLTGTNSQNSVVTQSTTATVTVLPLAQSNPSVVNSTCSSPSNSVNLNLTFLPSGNPSYTLQWSPPPQNYNSVNSQTATGLQPGPNSVTITTQGGCKTIVQFTVAPIQTPASFTVFNPANSYTITCSNPNVVLNTSVTGNASLNFTWTGCQGTSTGNSLVVTAPCVGNVTGASSSGCTSTQTFQVFQNFSAPSVSVTPTLVTVNCNTNTPVTFTATSNQSVNVISQWYIVNNNSLVPVGAAQGNTNILSPTSAGTYIATFSNALTGCSGSQTVYANFQSGMPLFTVTSTSNFTIGCGSTSVTSIQVSSVQTTPVPGGGASYAFSPPGYTGPPNFTNVPTYNNITVPGTYTVYVKDNNNSCISSQQISIIQNTLAPSISFIQPYPQLSCIQNSMVLTGISSNTMAQITWTVPGASGSSVWPQSSYTVFTNPAVSNATSNITSVGIFTVGAYDPNNQCKSTKTVQIIQDIRLPVLTPTTSPLQITCKDADVVLLNAQASNTMNAALITTYCWIPPIVSNSVCNTQMNTSVPGVHTCIATSNQNGCNVVKTYTVLQDIVPPALAPNATFTLDCSPNPTVLILPQFTGTTTGLTYSWTAPPNVMITNPTASFQIANGTGIYKLDVTNTVNGCRASAIYDVVPGSITASFVPDKSEGFAPLSVQFTNQSSTSLGSNGILSQWFFSNGNTSQNFNASQTFASPGVFTVVLVVQKGPCVDTARTIIRVDIPSKLEVPNIFSPNGDGVNDVFRFIASNLAQIKIKIFDRWGNVVYDLNANASNIGWDGKNLQGKDCAEGVYFFILEAEGKDGEKYNKKGNITLFR